MGHLFVDSLTRNQQDPVMAYILIVGIFAVLANFVADLVYAVLDPRIRVAG
jgi:peptide/nickel transport system permease protein